MRVVAVPDLLAVFTGPHAVLVTGTVALAPHLDVAAAALRTSACHDPLRADAYRCRYIERSDQPGFER